MFKSYAIIVLYYSLYKNYQQYTWSFLNASITTHNQYLLCLIEILAKKWNFLYSLFTTRNTVSVYKTQYNETLNYFFISVVHTYVFLVCVFLVIELFISNSRDLKTILALTSLIILGVIWSGHEVLWNGMWDWNFLELAILLLFLTIVGTSHSFKYKFFYNNKILFFVCLYFVYTKYSTVEIIHSFVNTQYLSFSNLTFLIIILYYTKNSVIFVTVLVWFLVNQQVNISWITTNYNKFFFVTNVLLYLVLVKNIKLLDFFFLPSWFFIIAVFGFLFTGTKNSFSKRYLNLIHMFVLTQFTFFLFLTKLYIYEENQVNLPHLNILYKSMISVNYNTVDYGVFLTTSKYKLNFVLVGNIIKITNLQHSS